jgi:hypothetical protein
MLIKIFSLAFDPLHNGFDDSEIRDFIKDKEVLSIQEFFFVRHQTPYLALVVKLHDTMWPRVTLNTLTKSAEIPHFVRDDVLSYTKGTIKKADGKDILIIIEITGPKDDQFVLFRARKSR